MANPIVFSLSKLMLEALEDIQYQHNGTKRVYVSWYDKRTLNALHRRDLVKFTQIRSREPRVQLTKHGACLLSNLKPYISR